MNVLILLEKAKEIISVTESESRLRNSIPNSETIPARTVGYSWGAKDEHERLMPLIKAAVKIIEVQANALEWYAQGRPWRDDLGNETQLAIEAQAQAQEILNSIK